MMRDELRRRQALLHAMGITTWYPRVLLPGAPPPLDWSDDEDPAAEALSPTVAPPAEARAREVASAALLRAGSPADAASLPANSRAGATSLPSDPPAGPAALSPAWPADADTASVALPLSPTGRSRAGSALAADRPLAPEASSAATVEAPPRFSLVFLDAGAGLGLVALLPQTAEAWLGPLRRALLAELLAARVGLRLAPELNERPFHWPLGPGLDDSASAARAALGGFLDEQAEAAGCRLLLVLGEQLAPLLPVDAQARRGVPYSLPEQPWRLLLTRSLDEALTVPALKRELWRDLAPLAGALP